MTTATAPDANPIFEAYVAQTLPGRRGNRGAEAVATAIHNMSCTHLRGILQTDSLDAKPISCEVRRLTFHPERGYSWRSLGTVTRVPTHDNKRPGKFHADIE